FVKAGFVKERPRRRGLGVLMILRARFCASVLRARQKHNPASLARRPPNRTSWQRERPRWVRAIVQTAAIVGYHLDRGRGFSEKARSVTFLGYVVRISQLIIALGALAAFTPAIAQNSSAPTNPHQAACDRGVAAACNFLALDYLRGDEGTPKDTAKAV